MNVSFTSKLGKNLASSCYALREKVKQTEDPGEFIVYKNGDPIQLNQITDDFIRWFNNQETCCGETCKSNNHFKVKTLKEFGIKNTCNIDEFIIKNESVFEREPLPETWDEAFRNESGQFRNLLMVLSGFAKPLHKDLQPDGEDYGWIALANKYISEINNIITTRVKDLSQEQLEEIIRRKSS